jgi:hypothetical protein
MKTRSITHPISSKHENEPFRSISKSGFSAICFLFMIFGNLMAQPELIIFTDMGKNNVSQDIFIKSAVAGEIKNLRNAVSAGFQFDLKNINGSRFSGLRVNAKRIIMIKPLPLDLNAFFTETYYSELLHETNYGTFLTSNLKHFEVTLGISFRTYTFTEKAITGYEIGRDASKLSENFNLIYSLSYFVRSAEKKWNAGILITDSDFFVTNQSTNPTVGLLAHYKVNPSLSLNVQAWYKTAGLLNLHMNYFEFFIRTGITWNFN